MSKYVKGKYHVVACDKRFNALKVLQENIDILISFEQNDMTVDEVDIELVDSLKDNIVQTLNTWFEDKLNSTTIEEE
tara:strand:+ start:4986 stop:5216 length:231 start_codon:yes stop_codon:yes gene_type:complete